MAVGDRPSWPWAAPTTGSAESAAAPLGEPSAWTALLARAWDDGGAALAGVVALAGAHPGAAGAPCGAEWTRGDRRRVWSTGDPSTGTVDRDVVAAVAPAPWALAAAAHVTVATPSLGSRRRRRLSDGTVTVLRGLGYLTVDRSAADAVRTALDGWARVQPPRPDRDERRLSPLHGHRRAERYVAVQDTANARLRTGRVRGAGDSRGRERTGRRPPFAARSSSPGPAGIAAGIAAGYVAIALDMDGTWDAAPTGGSPSDPDDATRVALADAMCSDDRTRRFGRHRRQARVVYERRRRSCSATPVPPRHRRRTWWAPLARRGAGPGLAATVHAEPGGSSNESVHVTRFTRWVTNRLISITESDDARIRHPVVIFGACPDG